MKRAILILFAAAVALLAGCSSLLEKEYFTTSDYDLSEEQPPVGDFGAIESYSELMDALNSLIASHSETAQLQFSGYAGSISDDLAEACWQVKSATALGAYMVDYISYDISRIVSYYQATVYINYTRSEEEMDAIRTIGADKIADTVVEAVSSGAEKLAIQIYTSSIDVELMAERVRDALLESPGEVAVMPQVEVEVYSGSNNRHIFDLSFDYGVDSDELSSMSARLKSSVESAAGRIAQDDAYSVSVLAAGVIGSLSSYDAGYDGGTAYDALVLGRGGSRALSMAYSAICSAKGIENMVVSGLRDNVEHYWVLVRINDCWYHIDVTEAMHLGSGTVFLFTDSEMASEYRWDELKYPACEGPSLYRGAEETAPPSAAPSEQPIEEEIIN